MDNNISKAIEDVNSIKSTLQDLKIHYHGIYLLCFILGSYHIIIFFLVITSFILSTFNFYTILYPLFTIFMFLSFLFVLYKEQKYSNKYYLSLLNIWAIIAIAIPVMTTLIDIIKLAFFKKDMIMLPVDYMYDIRSFSQVLLFCIFLFVSSYLLNQKYLKLVSLIILFIYLLLASCFNNTSISLFQNDVQLSIISIYNFLIIYLGYIVLGILIKKRERL